MTTPIAKKIKKKHKPIAILDESKELTIATKYLASSRQRLLHSFPRTPKAFCVCVPFSREHLITNTYIDIPTTSLPNISIRNAPPFKVTINLSSSSTMPHYSAIPTGLMLSKNTIRTVTNPEVELVAIENTIGELKKI
jgi:hypothetical protein